MLRVYTGRGRLMQAALSELLRRADARTQLVVVPKQLTLQTERTLLRDLNQRGSFQIQVLSPERLCARIFDAAGQPEGVRVDDRGRVMLVRAAVRAAGENLTLYRGAERRRGFPERCAAQLERIRQAGVTADTLRACAADLSGTARLKLNDLSYILEAYDVLIKDRYQDGTSEFNAAIARAGEAAFLRECAVWFHGFDMMPPTLHGLIASVSAVTDAGLLLPLENDERARDFDAFLPMFRALEQLSIAARRLGAPMERVDVEEAENGDAARNGSAPAAPARELPRTAAAIPSADASLPQESARSSAMSAAEHNDAHSRAAATLAAEIPASPTFSPSTSEIHLGGATAFSSSGKSHRPRLLVSVPPRKADLRRLERELFAFPAEPSAGRAQSVQLTLLRDPKEECRFAAALTRRLVRQRGWRWDDVTLLLRDPDAYDAPLRAAFADYGVPLFLSSSRSAARHAAPEFLLTALKALEKGFPADEMLALLRTGMSPLNDDEADRFSNYIVRWGLRGNRFLRPLQRGTQAELDALEPLRARLAEPLVRLRDRLRRSQTLTQQLTALFGLLTDAEVYSKIQARMARLCEANLREIAGEEGQVWNRMLGAMDQMQALMGDAKLSMAELRETLTESLSAAVLKPLPQSGDAVLAQSMDRACARPSKAILILGAADRPVNDDEGLLTPSQKRVLSDFAHAYLGPDDADLSRLRRFYLKSSLGMATDYVSLSCPLSGSDGAAQRPGAIFALIEALFPGTQTRGGVAGEPALERMLRSAPGAALSMAGRALCAEAEGVPLPEIDASALSALRRSDAPAAKTGLRRLSQALSRAESADALSPAAARALYGALSSLSITRLERFAACPFAFFAQYGLKPERVDPFELNAKDEGTFFHSAVNEFLLRSMDDLGELTAEAAGTRMDAVSDLLLDAMRASGPLGDSAVALAERRRLKSTARVCAAVLAEHMRGSRFHTAALEQSFGREDGKKALTLPGGCVLEGRIDRIDEWRDGKTDYLRVIDFKRGGKSLKLSEAYYGLRLQLPIYLAAAQRRRDALSAGVYYFTLDEGIVDVQSADPGAVEAERRKLFRMEGLMPGDPELLKALSPAPADVLKLRTTASGALYKGSVTAEESDYRALTECALRRAGEHLSRIRSGECAAAPARIEQSNPCAWCDWHKICLFDDRLDGARARKFKALPMDEALLKIKAENGAEEPEKL